MHKTDMAEGSDGIGLFVEISRIAIHEGFLVAEADIASKDLRIGQAFLVKSEYIRVFQIDAVLRLYRSAASENKEGNK